MAQFEHRRYPALTLQDNDGIWAEFTEELREFGEHKIRIGVLETDDPKLIARLRAATKTDPDLHEVGGGDSSTEQHPQVPPGMSVSATEAWVGDDKDRARLALAAEEAAGENARKTLVARLEAVIAAE